MCVWNVMCHFITRCVRCVWTVMCHFTARCVNCVCVEYHVSLHSEVCKVCVWAVMCHLTARCVRCVCGLSCITSQQRVLGVMYHFTTRCVRCVECHVSLHSEVYKVCEVSRVTSQQCV